MHAFSVRERAILEGTVSDSYIPLIERLSDDIAEIERQMGRTAKGTQELPRSIPGIGKTAAAMLLACVGNIERFETQEKFAVYIGIDSRVYQSGTSVYGKGYISKRGNLPLRHFLFLAVFIAVYYLKKRGEGKHYFVALFAIERRILNRIFVVWKRGTPYEKTVTS